jgi:hypothetical protein
MPTSRASYDPAKCRDGAVVRIASRSALEAFLKNWKLHHPLQPAQLDYADRSAKVAKSGMYHGGDVLYELEGIPGIWHEQCLEAV